MANSNSKRASFNKTELTHLHSDLQMSIFSRLPVKTLCQNKCVSTEWYGIISSTSFTGLYKDFAENNRQLFILDQFCDDNDTEDLQTTRISSLNTDGEPNYSFSSRAKGYIDLIPSGHSLLCLVCKEQFFILNPITKHIISLPPHSQPPACEHLDAAFGFIPSENKYKLVHLFGEETEEGIGCEILTLSLDPRDKVSIQSSWKEIEATCPFMVHGWGVCVGGVFYWLIWDGCTHEDDELIVSLDLETEEFEIVPHPHPLSYHEGNDMLFVEMKGYLCLVDTFAYPTVTDIWFLIDPEKKIWVKEFRIDLSSLQGFNDELTQITPLGYQNEEIIIHSGQNRLDFYNVKTKCFRRGPVINLKKDSLICLYTESFVSLPSSRKRIGRIR